MPLQKNNNEKCHVPRNFDVLPEVRTRLNISSVDASKQTNVKLQTGLYVIQLYNTTCILNSTPTWTFFFERGNSYPLKK